MATVRTHTYLAKPLPSPLWPPPSHYQAPFRHYQATTKPPLAITKPWTVITQTCRALTFSVIAHGTQNRQYCCLPSAGERIARQCPPLPWAPPKQTTPRDHHTWADHTCTYCLTKRPTPPSHQAQGLSSGEVARFIEEDQRTDRAQTLGRPLDRPCRHDAV